LIYKIYKIRARNFEIVMQFITFIWNVFLLFNISKIH